MTYYPYLRTKQFELIALRDLSKIRLESDVIPVLEPVRDLTSSSASKSIGEWLKVGRSIAVLLNPAVGDIEEFNFESYLAMMQDKVINAADLMIPGLIMDPEYHIVRDQLRKLESDLSRLLVVVDSPDDLNRFKDLFREMPSISEWHVLVGNSIRSRNIRGMGNGGARILFSRLEDAFRVEARNADYEDGAEDFYSDEARFFADEGREGFADYTTLGSKYAEGGFMPYAVALHWSFIKNDGIYIAHFVSDNKRSAGMVKEKFFEAAKKLEIFIDNKELTGEGVNQFKHLMGESKYPGLGVIKKLSIVNHIETATRLASVGEEFSKREKNS